MVVIAITAEFYYLEYRNPGNFRVEKFSRYKFFVATDELRKYFNADIFLTRGRKKRVREIQLQLAGMEEFERICCIRGYHVYKEIWEAAAGEVLTL